MKIHKAASAHYCFRYFPTLDNNHVTDYVDLQLAARISFQLCLCYSYFMYHLPGLQSIAVSYFKPLKHNYS